MPDDQIPKTRRRIWPWVLGAVAGLMLIGIAGIAATSARTAWRNSLETGAIDTCRAYCSAQIMHKRNDWDEDSKFQYAEKPDEPLLDGVNPDMWLLHPASKFAAAHGETGRPLHGYLFQEMQTIAGRKIDWVEHYALCATPAVYGKTGYRTFIVTTDRVIFGKDLGHAAFVTDYPQDPTAEGWAMVE